MRQEHDKLRHSKDKWQRIEERTNNQLEHFVPFYYKENNALLHEKNNNPITFPNYMNWYNQGEDASSRRQIPPKKAYDANRENQDPQQMAYYRSGQDHKQRHQSSYGHFNYGRQDSSKTRLANDSADQEVFKAVNVDNKRQQKLDRLRQELQEYQDYQFRRPFQPSELPSNWTSSRQDAKIARSKGRSQFHFEEAISEPKGFQEKRQTMPISEASTERKTMPKRGHLNRGLKSIMADEPGVSFHQPGKQAKSGHYSYFPGKDQSENTPYLRNKQAKSNRGNGDLNENE
ncbi:MULTISPECIES: hypothetical protein [Aerococcus]|uniref:hypothetical protein n=1 Tax=Aerococcus TaxID=1375 RepID=UPI000A5144EE|nr:MULTISPECIES: hypothetical protein [Aerococcus]